MSWQFTEKGIHKSLSIMWTYLPCSRLERLTTFISICGLIYFHSLMVITDFSSFRCRLHFHRLQLNRFAGQKLGSPYCSLQAAIGKIHARVSFVVSCAVGTMAPLSGRVKELVDCQVILCEHQESRWVHEGPDGMSLEGSTEEKWTRRKLKPCRCC